MRDHPTARWTALMLAAAMPIWLAGCPAKTTTTAESKSENPIAAAKPAAEPPPLADAEKAGDDAVPSTAGKAGEAKWAAAKEKDRAAAAIDGASHDPAAPPSAPPAAKPAAATAAPGSHRREAEYRNEPARDGKGEADELAKANANARGDQQNLQRGQPALAGAAPGGGAGSNGEVRQGPAGRAEAEAAEAAALRARQLKDLEERSGRGANSPAAEGADRPGTAPPRPFQPGSAPADSRANGTPLPAPARPDANNATTGSAANGPANDARRDRDKDAKEQLEKQRQDEALALNQAKKLDEERKNKTSGKPDDKPGKEAGDGFGDAKGDGNKKEPARKRSTVWHRDAQRPSFARVYVGDGNSLELVSIQVTTTIEGPRARTVVDHIFRNPSDRQLEGTFEYPLPTGASASYFAMFLGHTRSEIPARFGGKGAPAPLPQEALARLAPEQLVRQISTQDWGRLQEGRIVGKEKALEVYEEIVRTKADPALLQYAGGNTFSGRVFPIPAKGYNRVILAYEELLPFAGEGMHYRFPLPDCKLNEMSVRVNAVAADCKGAVVEPADVVRTDGAGRTLFAKSWEGQGPGGELRLTLKPANPQVQVTGGRQDGNGPVYVYARIRPELKDIAAAPFAGHAVFLLDTSLSENPDRFDVSVRLMEAILAGDKDIKSFNVLCFDTAAKWLNPAGWMANDAAGRKAALAKLDGILLEGATDVSAALDKLCKPVFDLADGSPLNVFLLSDGQATWGEKDSAPMAARFESRCKYATRFHCYRIGIGAENTELFEALTRKGGGVFQCYGEADLPAAAAAHRSQCLTVDKVGFAGGPAASDVLTAGRRTAIYPGGELVVAAKMTEPGASTVIIQGTFAGKKFAFEQPVEFAAGGELAARGWGEIAVASLLALNDPKLEPLAVAYCQQFGVASRVASFLVLDDENDYKRLNLQEERGKTLDREDLGVALDKLWQSLGRPTTAKEMFERFLERADARTKVLSGPNGVHVQRLLKLLKDTDFELPEADSGDSAVLYNKDVPPAYLADRRDERAKADAMIAEASRRAAAHDPLGAARALSGIVEDYPARSDALRLVGYRLMDLDMPASAVRLFSRVQADRPFEPHTYRDLARSLELSGKYAWAAVNYEIVLAGTWHARFQNTMAIVAREEYVRLMRRAVRDKGLDRAVANRFGERLEQLSAGSSEDDIRVTVSWNTDGTDVDLWVVEPDGTKCFYSHNRTKNGGELSADMTDGYGPERYRMKKAKPGPYAVKVHYYRANPSLLAGESHVEVTVTRHADTPQETVERYNVVLKKADQVADVTTIKF